MSYQRLTIFVEGDNDSRFFETIIKPIFENKGINVEIQKWSQKEIAFTKEFIRCIANFNSYTWGYIFTSDMDHFEDQEEKIEYLINRFDIGHDKAVIVIKEIEGWYLAGLTESGAKEVGISVSKFKAINPNTVEKEHFCSLIPKNFLAERSFYSEILKHFDHNTALTRNKSYQVFSSMYEL